MRDRIAVKNVFPASWANCGRMLARSEVVRDTHGAAAVSEKFKV